MNLVTVFTSVIILINAIIILLAEKLGNNSAFCRVAK